VKYHFICHECQEVTEADIPIGEYHRNPPTFVHCGKRQERYFPPVPFRASDNILAGDRHYDGLQAQDGTNISTRSKHQAYMKANNLSLADDYKDMWAKAEQKRAEYRTGKAGGAVTRDDIARALHQIQTR
jgi:hypothetical protein